MTFTFCIFILCVFKKLLSIVCVRTKFAILIYMDHIDTETLLKNTSRSLYLSVQALPGAMRPAFSIAYLLCRYADSIADTALLPAERRIYWISRFPSLIQEQNPQDAALLSREISGKTDNPYEKTLIQNLTLCLKDYNQITAGQQEMILEVVRAVCEGMRTDLAFFPTEQSASPKPFPDAAHLERYCRLMGGMPGLFWSKLIRSTTRITVPEQTFYEWGQQIGDALQIVNILRDLPQDLRIGRCYFPETDLAQARLTAPDLLKPENAPRFEPVKQKWIKWGTKRLQSGKEYFRRLPKTQFGQRAAVAWPMLWTADTLYKVSQTPDLLNPARRVKIPRRRIYLTLLATPLILLSNAAFSVWLDSKIRRLNQSFKQ